MLSNFKFQKASKLFEHLKLIKSICYALLHIAREQFKVMAANSHLATRFLRVAIRRLSTKIKSRKLTLVIYGLFIALTLKFITLTAATFSSLQPPAGSSQIIDFSLLFFVIALIYILGAIIKPLIRMERHDNKDILKFGDDFGQLLSLRGAVESMPEAFSFWDKNKQMVLSNAKFSEVYHLNTEDGSTSTDYFRFGARVNQLMMRAARPGKTYDTAQYEAQMRDGRWLYIHETPTVDGGLVRVSFDVTKLKSSQQNLAIREQQMRTTVEELRASRRELERKTQKLAELADKYMREKDRAEEGNRVKTEFLANISHELRTPLNAIIGFSDLMQRQVLGPIENEHYAGYVNDIHMSGSYLLELINDILDMSRIEAGRLTLETSHCSLKSLISECLHIIGPQAQNKHISLTESLKDDVHLIIDQRAIKQVMLNLISNAIKFTPENGTVELSVELTSSAALIYVKDSGIGIEKSAISKLGKPFQQVENQLTKSHTGTGLGLAISRSLVDLHGGTLVIESKVGVGTTVLVTLPFGDNSSDKQDKETTTSVKSIAA